MTRPELSEYNTYYSTYLNLVEGKDYFEALADNTNEVIALYTSMSNEKLNFRYAENKWSPKEILIHLIEKECAMLLAAYTSITNDRSLQLSTDYEELQQSSVEDLLRYFTQNRKQIQLFFANRPQEQLELHVQVRITPLSLRALGYSIIGHASHHIKTIRERYMLSMV